MEGLEFGLLENGDQYEFLNVLAGSKAQLSSGG
jgi:hypothetical protein